MEQEKIDQYLIGIQRKKAELDLREQTILKEKKDYAIGMIKQLVELTNKTIFNVADVVGNEKENVWCIFIGTNDVVECYVTKIHYDKLLSTIKFDIRDCDGYEFQDVYLSECQNSILDNLIDHLIENFNEYLK